MANATSLLLPGTGLLLQHLGERLRLARLRRRLQSRQVAERAGMTLVTLRKIERGSPGVTIGAYLAVLQVLQLEEGLDLLAAEDSLGRRLQDIEGETGMRPRRRRRSAPAEAASVGKKEKVLTPDESAMPENENRGVSGDELFAYLASLSSADTGEPPHG